MVELLLDKRANAHAIDGTGVPVQIYCVVNNDVDPAMIRLAISGGVHINQRIAKSNSVWKCL